MLMVEVCTEARFDGARFGGGDACTLKGTTCAAVPRLEGVIPESTCIAVEGDTKTVTADDNNVRVWSKALFGSSRIATRVRLHFKRIDSSSDESAVQSPKSFRTVLIGHYGWFLGVSGASFFYRSFEISKLKFTGQSSFGPPFKPRKRMKPPSPTSPTGHFLVMIACSGFC
ncbi:unnamed protein product [Mesocestoides corti]|uniref:Uncharacterized protein n=1 Tax=Mesocestoides corti TaxID=53468 RepID=A0A0R3UAQ1_MESCO|nr:unnamed protein product [Mesocestoides corti]